MIYIIGCGGVGSWLTPALAMLESPKDITLVDGDKLELKNMNRQLFDESQIGQNKARSLADKYGCHFIEKWYSEAMTEHFRQDWLICCADNNPARKSALAACDMSGCSAIFGANETHSSEAFIYHPEWRDTGIDPRTYYPEILSDFSGNPAGAAIGCTGEVQRQNPQLATANMMAAAIVAHLFMLWHKEVPKMDSDAFMHLPYKIVNNLTRSETYVIKNAKLTKTKETK